MELKAGKKIYFLSDFHLGAPNHLDSLLREKKVVAFLDSIKKDAAEVFIVGDIFDFWFEYKTVVPRGYTRLLGKLAELADSGIQLHVFVGNHDMWMKDYFMQEFNTPVYFEPRIFKWEGQQFYIGHGDGLGPGDHGFKFIKKIFRNPFCQWLFGILHPNLGIGLANYLSRKSREKTGDSDALFLGAENEWLIVYAKEYFKQNNEINYFIFGHRHYPIDYPLGDRCRYINLGDWIRNFTYACFDGNDLQLLHWKD
ncbi:MAG: UDP-2,3-diacylglucosamine diphosphatase [Chitinophagaceae bacterium]|nr:UDP-2,3-diacylglucosamine diphosphatase [Chitinophagaceae bacterium]